MIRFLTYLIILLVYQTTSFSNEKSKFFEIGQEKYTEKKFEEAKFNFQKDIVRNPKNTKSYLYLAKIFKELNNENIDLAHKSAFKKLSDYFNNNYQIELYHLLFDITVIFCIFINAKKDRNYSYRE